MPMNSLFHTVGYKNHSVGYIFHSVGYKSRTAKQRNCPAIPFLVLLHFAFNLSPSLFFLRIPSSTKLTQIAKDSLRKHIRVRKRKNVI